MIFCKRALLGRAWFVSWVQRRVRGQDIRQRGYTHYVRFLILLGQILRQKTLFTLPVVVVVMLGMFLVLHTHVLLAPRTVNLLTGSMKTETDVRWNRNATSTHEPSPGPPFKQLINNLTHPTVKQRAPPEVHFTFSRRFYPKRLTTISIRTPTAVSTSAARLIEYQPLRLYNRKGLRFIKNKTIKKFLFILFSCTIEKT